MKLFYAGLLAICFAACSTKPPAHKPRADRKLPVRKFQASYQAIKKSGDTAKNDTGEINQQADAFADYYIVVADTGTNYNTLHEKMVRLKNAVGILIDTLGRSYDKKKDLIALPDDDSDEIYAGDYAPRRYPSANLSLEYMNYYSRASKKKTIGLVAGIYDNKTSADSLLRSLQSSNAFDFEAKVYIGCMH